MAWLSAVGSQGLMERTDRLQEGEAVAAHPGVCGPRHRTRRQHAEAAAGSRGALLPVHGACFTVIQVPESYGCSCCSEV